MTKISEYAERVDIIRERHKKFLDELDKNNIDYFSERNSILASENTELAYENTLKQGTSDQTLIFAMDASRAAIKANLDTRLLLQGQVEANSKQTHSTLAQCPWRSASSTHASWRSTIQTSKPQWPFAA